MHLSLRENTPGFISHLCYIIKDKSRGALKRGKEKRRWGSWALQAECGGGGVENFDRNFSTILLVINSALEYS